MTFDLIYTNELPNECGFARSLLSTHDDRHEVAFNWQAVHLPLDLMHVFTEYSDNELCCVHRKIEAPFNQRGKFLPDFLFSSVVHLLVRDEVHNVLKPVAFHK